MSLSGTAARKRLNKESPIVIGGVGGSGTRVVAEILMNIGVFLGRKLNESHDNLWFSVLFKRKDCLQKKKEETDSEIRKALDIFTTAMIGDSNCLANIRFLIAQYAKNIQNTDAPNNELVAYFNDWHGFAEDMASSPGPQMKDCIGWGWKEPNSHVWLENLATYYEDIRYIHVIRHGLDMAYSNNQNQLRLWGAGYGVVPANDRHDPAASFRYWVNANRKAILSGKALLKERFLVIEYERLCHFPKEQIGRLLDFLQLNLADRDLERLVQIPSPPASIGRYRTQDNSWLTEDDAESLRVFNYEYVSNTKA